MSSAHEIENDAAQLQDCLDRIAAGEPIEVVLADVGASADLESLVRLALAAGQVLPAAAPAAFRARAQADLQALLIPRRPQRWRRLVPRLAGLAAAVALVLATAVVASADSLPGDTFYGFKRATEAARLALTFDPVARVGVHLDHVDARTAEIQALIDRGLAVDAAVIEALISSRSAAADEARAAGDEGLVERVERQSAAAGASLASVVGQVGDPAERSRIERAAEDLSAGGSGQSGAETPSAVSTSAPPSPVAVEPTATGAAVEPTVTPTTAVTPLPASPTATRLATPSVTSLPSPVPVRPEPTRAGAAPTMVPPATEAVVGPTEAAVNLMGTQRAIRSAERAIRATESARLTEEARQTEQARRDRRPRRTPTRKPRPPNDGTPWPVATHPPPDAPVPTPSPSPAGPGGR